MTWFLVETTDTHDFISAHDPDPDNPTVWVVHPPEPYKAAHMSAKHASSDGVDVSDLDTSDGESFMAEYVKRALKVKPGALVDQPYDWVLLGLSKIIPPDSDPITDIDMDLLHKIPHEIIQELADKIGGLAQVDSVTEKNSGSPSESKD